MRNCILLSSLCLFLLGCAEQKPAQVVAASPTTYKPLPPSVEKPSSRVAMKMRNAADQQPDWMWPTKGKVLSKFLPNSTRKGIDISGFEGTPVFAASDGEVIYSGNSLKGYGNLIIIKHKNNYLSAYAHNRKNMVKEGDRVIIGQRIAEMGSSGTDKVKLHFEIRQDGKPVDPQRVLPLK